MDEMQILALIDAMIENFQSKQSQLDGELNVVACRGGIYALEELKQRILLNTLYI